MLEQNTTRNGQVDEKVRQMKFYADDDGGKYKVEAIWESTVYIKESESGYLPGLYYLILWKRYPNEKNIWEPALAVQHLRKLINLFHKDHPDKPIATSLTISIAPPIVGLTAKSIEPLKQKRGRLAKKRTTKHVKWG